MTVSQHKLSLVGFSSIHITNFTHSLVLLILVWHNTVHRGGRKPSSEGNGGWSGICLMAAMELAAKPWQW